MKTWTPEIIKQKIDTDQRWLERAVLAIYNKQTSREQRLEKTKELNYVGFSAAHAYVMSYCATWLLKGNHLSGTWLEKARKVMNKYSKQLTKIANKEIR